MSSCSTLPTGATSPTTSAATSYEPSSRPGASSVYADAVPTRKQRRRRRKSFRHEYEYVLVDEEGNEVEVDEERAPPKTAAKAGDKDAKTTANKAPGAKA